MCICACTSIRTSVSIHSLSSLSGVECFKEVFIKRKEWDDRGIQVQTPP